MKIWKPLTKFYYSDQRNEYKYHTDFSLEVGEEIVITINGKRLLKDYVLYGQEKKYHLEMAVESFEGFAEKPEEIYNGEFVSESKVGGTD